MRLTPTNLAAPSLSSRLTTRDRPFEFSPHPRPRTTSRLDDQQNDPRRDHPVQIARIAATPVPRATRGMTDSAVHSVRRVARRLRVVVLYHIGQRPARGRCAGTSVLHRRVDVRPVALVVVAGRTRDSARRTTDLASPLALFVAALSVPVDRSVDASGSSTARHDAAPTINPAIHHSTCQARLARRAPRRLRCSRAPSSHRSRRASPSSP